MCQQIQGKVREGNRTEMCFSRVDEDPDSVETGDCKLNNSCNEDPSSTPGSTNGKVPTDCSSEGTASGFQTVVGLLVRDGSKRASNDL